MKIIKPSFEIIEESDPLKKIEICGRVCYKSEDKITPDSSVRFVQNIIKRGHESVLEHANFIVCCDSYDMNMFVNICDYARSFDSETILLRTTQKNHRNIISGNARMWRDFMRYTQKIGVTSNIFTIFKGILFDDVNTTTQGRTTAKFVDEKFLTEEEREIHCVETVRFITDRGVSHEIVRHRMSSFSQESTRYCRYNDEVTFIKPCFDVPELWYEFMQMAENTYISMLENGNTPQEARSVLPNEVKTEIIVTTNRKNWRHFFELRTSTAAHPQMRELAIPLQGEMLRRWENDKKRKIEYIGDFCEKHQKCSSCPLNEKINGISYCPINCNESCTDGELDAIIDIIDTFIPTVELPQNEEINHPDRYANDKYECIDVMVDVFGIEATKAFCKLNAFKYLWREERKNGLQDVKKAAWYVNKYIELSESGDEENV